MGSNIEEHICIVLCHTIAVRFFCILCDPSYVSQIWIAHGSLLKFTNQGSEASNHYHRLITERQGTGSLVNRKRGAMGSSLPSVLQYHARHLNLSVPSLLIEAKAFTNAQEDTAGSSMDNPIDYSPRISRRKRSASMIATKNMI